MAKIRSSALDRKQVPCNLCGDPMLQSKGKMQEEHDPQTGKDVKVQSPNQIAYWHKACRTEGRRLALKRGTSMRSVVHISGVRTLRWFAYKTSYGTIRYKQ